MKLQMSEITIVGKYRRADKKKEQITILSQLNDCSEEDIVDILLKNGVTEDELPKKRRKKGGRLKVTEKVIEKTLETPKNTAKKTQIEKEVEQTGREVLDDIETPVLTTKEEEQVGRALSIPEEVRTLVNERIKTLTGIIIELEKERDVLCDYLNGVVSNA